MWIRLVHQECTIKAGFSGGFDGITCNMNKPRLAVEAKGTSVTGSCARNVVCLVVILFFSSRAVVITWSDLVVVDRNDTT